MQRLFFIVLVFSPIASIAQNTDKPTILFVCEHGAAKSVIAAAYFNKIAKERGLNYQAVFRGTDPIDGLTPGAKEGLIKDGFDISKMTPSLVSKDDVAKVNQVITFDCVLPEDYRATELQQWHGVPPISENYDKARDQVVWRVEALITQLLKNKK
jgi:protein-tyrosine-phosphatase